MQRSQCQQFAAALSGLAPDNIPTEAMHGAKRALLDALGSALAGVGTVEVEATIRAARAGRGSGPITVWGTPLGLSAPHAALVNGTAVHAREVDDFGGCGHSGAVVMPAALAAAELHDVPGAVLLTAIVTGYEAAARVTDLNGGYADHNAEGWHSTGTCGIFGAAAAAARVLALSAEQMTHAIALSGTYTGGIWAFIADGAMSKRLHAGKAAEGGLTAALLAQQNMTGPTRLFEPGWGSFTTLYGGKHADLGALLRDFGTDFLIFRSGFKPYACCRGCHSSLDAVLQLQEQHKVTLADVDHVTIRASEQAARQLGKQDVHNILDAQMSLPYSIAVALRHGRADLEHYQAPYLDDPELTALARRISVVPEAHRPTSGQPEVELHLKSGHSVSAMIERAKGEHANPMTDDELLRKFFALATLHFDRAHAQQIADIVWSIERLASVQPLIALLRAG